MAAPSADIDDSPISAGEAKALLADWTGASAIVLAVSGGPDSTALMWLAARWRRAIKRGPKLIAVTIDHGLRPEAATEAAAVATLAQRLGLPHRTLRWQGRKPATGVPAAARAARYELLAQAAREAGAEHIFTAHTRDDQAETFLMRLSRGSGVAGLAAMARHTARADVAIIRPLLDLPKQRLIATLRKARVAFADDPTNRDPHYTRPRWRALMPALAREGIDARTIVRLTARLTRANAALDAVAAAAERSMLTRDAGTGAIVFDAPVFATLPDEIALRLLGRSVARVGHEGTVELGKLEVLLTELQAALAAGQPRWKRTLAGATIAAGPGAIVIAAAPPRRPRMGTR